MPLPVAHLSLSLSLPVCLLSPAIMSVTYTHTHRVKGKRTRRRRPPLPLFSAAKSVQYLQTFAFLRFPPHTHAEERKEGVVVAAPWTVFAGHFWQVPCKTVTAVVSQGESERFSLHASFQCPDE